MTTTKALIKTINYGDKFSFYGLMLPDGTYGISVSQANNLFQFSSTQNHAAQSLKRLCGEEFRPHKISTEEENQKHNVITLEQLETVAIELMSQGNEFAKEFVKLNTGGFLRQRFADAFGERFELEERDAWIKERLQSKVARNNFTEAVKDYYVSRGAYDPSSDSTRQMFARLTNITKAALGFPLTKNHRDDASKDDLVVYQHAERSIAMMISRKGLEPEEAINWYADIFMNE